MERLLGLMRGLKNRLDNDDEESSLLSLEKSLVQGTRELKFTSKEERMQEDANA